MKIPIPRRIIQTGKTSHLPLRARAAAANLKLLNPDFEYLYFNNEQVDAFIDQKFPQYRAIFDAFRVPIQRYDFFRYLAVYHYGGFYFDLDVFLASSLSNLLDSGCVFPFEGLTFSNYLRKQHEMDWQIGNYAFGAVPGHPFLRAIIDNCVRGQTDAQWVALMMKGLPRLSGPEFYVLNTTGPGLVSRTFAENPALTKAVTILFPEDVCDCRNWNRFGELGVHLMDGSWRMDFGFFRRRLAQYSEALTMRSLLKQSLKLGKTRTSVPKPASCFNQRVTQGLV